VSPVDSSTNQMVVFPLELRAALDLIAQASIGAGGAIDGHVVGSPEVMDAFGRYASVSLSKNLLICLLPDQVLIQSAVTERQSMQVWMLTTGPLHRILRPLRSQPMERFALVDDLSASQWAELGYARETTIGVQGFGSIAWAIGERICRRIGRPDFADRCRIGMLRSLIAARPLHLGSVHVHRYRRKAGP
jgi:hypothetical protein